MQRDINKVIKGNYCDDNKRCGHACVCRLHFGSSRLLKHIAFGVQEKNNNSRYIRTSKGRKYFDGGSCQSLFSLDGVQ